MKYLSTLLPLSLVGYSAWQMLKTPETIAADRQIRRMDRAITSKKPVTKQYSTPEYRKTVERMFA